MIPRQLAFEEQEYSNRVQLVQAWLAEHSIDALLSFSAENIYYLTGLDSEDADASQCVVIPAAGSPVLIVSAFEAGRVANSCWLTDVVLFDPFHEKFVDVVSRTVPSSGRAGCRIAVEDGRGAISAADYLRLAERMTACDIVSGSGVVETFRSVKSSAEIGWIRAAAAMTEAARAAVFESARRGASDRAVGAAITRELYRAGSDMLVWGPVVAVGYRASAPHCSMDGSLIGHGDAVFTIHTGFARHYVAPVMTTVVIGRMSRLMMQFADAGRRALDAVVASAKPGVPASTVARTGLTQLQEVLPRALFHHIVGYPIGAVFSGSWTERSGFFIRVDNDRPMHPGMVFHLPMSIRRQATFGIGQSRSILVTDSGVEVLTGLEDGVLEVI